MKVELMTVLQKITDNSNINLKVLTEEEYSAEHFYPDHMLYNRDPDELKEAQAAFIRTLEEAVLYCYRDAYDISYCIGLLPGQATSGKSVLVLGPYMGYAMDEAELAGIMAANGVPAEFERELREFYNAVPVISYAERWIALCKELFALFYPGQTVRLSRFLYDFRGLEFREEPPASLLSAKIIEERYALEGKLLSAVSGGDMETAVKLLGNMQKYRLTKRYPDTLRNIRNGMIVFNTLLRKAAEAGGVHPVHIDRLSEKFAKESEKVLTAEEAYSLRIEMLRQYCLLVRNYSLREHSPVIRKVVNHISVNLSEKLTLTGLAEQYFVNPSYLSTLFKKEMGVTVSSYINQQRVRLAVRLFNMGHTGIQEVAAQCGIDDVSYFRKLFKKNIGMSPSDYVRMINASGHQKR